MKVEDQGYCFEDRLAAHILSLIQDRAQRAMLRSYRPGEAIHGFDIYRALGRFLPEMKSVHRERSSMLGAYLAAAYPQCWGEGDISLGRGARPRNGEDDSESYGKRFTSLLDSDFEVLQKRLPKFLSLLEQKKRHVSLNVLIKDLARWHFEDSRVQRRWAKDFFAIEQLEEDQKESE